MEDWVFGNEVVDLNNVSVNPEHTALRVEANANRDENRQPNQPRRNQGLHLCRPFVRERGKAHDAHGVYHGQLVGELHLICKIRRVCQTTGGPVSRMQEKKRDTKNTKTQVQQRRRPKGGLGKLAQQAGETHISGWCGRPWTPRRLRRSQERRGQKPSSGRGQVHSAVP